MKLLILASVIVCLGLPAMGQEKKDTDQKLHLLVTGAPFPASVAALSIERGARYPSVIHLKGDVEIKWNGMRLFADQADYHEDTGEVEARGNVRAKPYPEHREPGRK